MLKIFVDGSAKGRVLGAGLVIKTDEKNERYTNSWIKNDYAIANLSELFAIKLAIKQVIKTQNTKAIIYCDNPMVVKEINANNRIIKTQLYKKEALRIRKILVYLKEKGCQISIQTYGKCKNNQDKDKLNMAHNLARDSYKEVDKFLLTQQPMLESRESIYLEWVSNRVMAKPLLFVQ